MCKDYGDLINEANSLMRTFTISYNVIGYADELYSSTYDELSGWVRKVLKCIEFADSKGRESILYQTIRKFRGRTGDLTLNIFKTIIQDLEIANA